METECPDRFSDTLPYKSCFVCSKNCVSEEIADSLLEVQGIPSTIEDKLNILKVLCQLLRVKWESIESLVKNDFTFPFCLNCLKSIIQIICLREQLFTIETDIRNRISQIESSVAKDLENGTLGSADWKHFMEEGEFDIENGGPYPDFKVKFQKQVMNGEKVENIEFCSKQILHIKMEDQLQKGFASMTELNPSMIQLHLSKNAFGIVDRESNSLLSQNLPRLCEDKETMTEVPETEDKPMNLRVANDNNLNARAEFTLTLVDNVDEVSDDSDYGSPSKKIKMRIEKPQQQFTPLARTGTEFVSESEQHSGNNSDNDWSKEFHNSSDTDSYDGSSEEDEPQLLLPSVTPGGTTSLNKMVSHSSKKVHPTDANNRSELPPRATKFKNQKDKSSRGIKMSGSNKKYPQSLRKARVLKNSKHIKNSTVCLTQDSETFQAKDGTVWSTEPDKNPAPVRKLLKNEINGGLVGAVKNPNLTPVELFKLMFCPKMATTIVGYTNAYAEASRLSKIQTAKGSAKPWKPMTQDELYAYIGILIYLGLEKKRNIPIDEVWNHDPKYVTPSVIATMSRERFDEISRFLRFDNRVAREPLSVENLLQSNLEAEEDLMPKIEIEHFNQSKTGYISQVFDPFVKNIQSHFRPYEKLVVDEMLVKYRGKVGFRVYMKSKPGKYGMKIWVLCDATTGYILRICIYEGKVGDKVETELGKKVVLGLVENYFGSGRTVTADNFFTSKSLGSELLKRNIKLLGTLNKNRMDVIPEFADGRGRSVESSMFAFQHPFAMVSYVQRKNRAVLLLSTAHSATEINPEIKNKPQMILDYNSSKGGVDTADQMIGNFSCQRTTRRWPVKLFQAMCDIGALNAYIIWKIHRSNDSDKDLYGLRRKFLRSLSEGLMDPIIKVRALNPAAAQLPVATRTAMEIMGHTIKKLREQELEEDYQRAGRRRCEFCTGSARYRKQSRVRCAGCHKYICASHWTRIIHCNKCPFKPVKDLEKLIKPRFQPQILFGIQSVPDMSGE